MNKQLVGWAGCLVKIILKYLNIRWRFLGGNLSKKIEFDSVTIKNWVLTKASSKSSSESDNATGGSCLIEFPAQMFGGDDEHLSAFEDRFTVVISSDYLQSWFSSAFIVQTWLCWQSGSIKKESNLVAFTASLGLKERSVQIGWVNVLLLYSFSVWRIL